MSDTASYTLTLPSSIAIDTVEALAQQCKEHSGSSLILDAEQTEIITTPGIQLLLVLSKTLAASGKSLTVTQPSTAFVQAFEQVGLKTKLIEWENSK